MMTRPILHAAALFALAMASCLVVPGTGHAHPHILKVDGMTEISPVELVDDLSDVRVVFVGEFHDHRGHHQAQLSIIEALAGQETPLAIGLEMFRHDNQPFLDAWVANEISLREFLPVYLDNWSMWEVYRPIFQYARAASTPLVGLNISREITAEVARNGFASLDEDQRRSLGDVRCVVNPTYGKYLRQALGGHGGQGLSYLYFCEAQMLWDTMMARRVVEFLQANPAYRMVVLAGSGHAWKFGIPRQMLEQADLSYRVVLPEVVGRIDRLNVRDELTDYLWLDVGDDGWSF